MNDKDQLLDDKMNNGRNNIYSHLGAQMFAPFYTLSNFFLNPINLQNDVVKEVGSKNEREMFTLEASKVSSKVYAILVQKAQANDMEDYITKLVEHDLEKMEKEESISLFEPIREEFLSEINILKQEFASRPVVNPNGMGSDQANDLRDSVTKLDEQKLDKEEFQRWLNTLRSEFFDQIHLLKNELTLRPAVPDNPNKSNPVKKHPEKVNDLKEGQLLESEQVTGTIKEVIDVDF